MKLVVIGLSITSSWGNGHATTFRALLKAFSKRGHEILFLERDVPYYANNRDLPQADFCQIELYKDEEDLKTRFYEIIRQADAVMVGSYVQNGTQIIDLVFEWAEGVKMFYDIDTPVTLAKISRGDDEYLHPDQIRKFDLYLSFSGGPIPEFIRGKYQVPLAKALYCSVDADLYFPENLPKQWQMGYLGTYSLDRQPGVEELLNKPAQASPDQNFVVAGPQYPVNYPWSKNIKRIEHLPPHQHRSFYNSQNYTLNITRKDMIKMGYSPSVRLFEAAACGVPVISDYWEGLDEFFEFDREILVAKSANDVLKYWTDISEEERMKIGQRARLKVMEKHTSDVRAEELEAYIKLVFSAYPKSELL